MELLAPAGNFECLKAAVQCGADAVYFSGKDFGARSFAENFNNEEIKKAIDYCHCRGVAAHITVNTLVTDRELKQAMDYIGFLYVAGADALIIQDLGLLENVHRFYPDIEIHASTQITAHNLDGVNALYKLGAKRVVLSRELSLNDIDAILTSTKADIEIFAHGALCMCYSGQCLMSSIIGGRSGNRGKCAQPCRLPYKINNNCENKFYMSLKDMCSIEYLKRFRTLGIKSLKIEGRMKGASYVASVVSLYRKYIDNDINVDKNDLELLNSIFYRGGLTDGYLSGKHGKTMFAFDKPDNPYKKESLSYLKKLKNSYENVENRKTKLKGSVDIIVGKKPIIKVWNDKCTAEYIGETIVEKAEKHITDCKSAKEQLLKTGGTEFEFEEICINISENVFISSKVLNDLRRSVLDLFREKLKRSFERKIDINYKIDDIKDKNQSKTATYSCYVTNMKQFEVVNNFEFKYIKIPANVVIDNLNLLLKYRERIIVSTPTIIRETNAEKWEKIIFDLFNNGFKNLEANNIAFLSDKYKRFNIYGGARLNIFNSYSLNVCRENNLKSVVLSTELTLKQISAIDKAMIDTECIGYGRIPLMVTENCIIRNGNACPCNNENYITDRKGFVFPVLKDCGECRSIIINSAPTYMGDKISDLNNIGLSRINLYFTIETQKECIDICNAYLNGTRYDIDNYTRAHFYKGVE